MIGNRPLSLVLGSVFQKQHYVALWNMYRNYPAFWENLKRYLLGRGDYPYEVQVKTPLGNVSPTLYSHHDLLTVNEIFCRQDYFSDGGLGVVVDLGSNIGISALYFMTRNQASRCYLFEPDPKNIERLHHNLAGFESRFVLKKAAVSDVSGVFRFGVEDTGRYGGIGVETDEYIEVDCLSINEVLREILEKEESIDVLKIDTEGIEIQTVKAIEEDLLSSIKRIYLEGKPEEVLHPRIFEQRQYGTVCQLVSKHREPNN
jgi:FkbM family methyltransferase